MLGTAVQRFRHLVRDYQDALDVSRQLMEQYGLEGY